MTLYRQLLLFACTILLILFAGLWLAKLGTTRSFLDDQLSSHAQDTATSLGLSISTLVGQMDVPAMEAMVNAIFDRGYYSRILIQDLEDTRLVERSLDIAVEQVPAWFIGLVPLKPPEAEAHIMDGWQRRGSVLVQSHPGYAYKTLWEMARTTALMFVTAALIVALVGGFGLSLLLRPLGRVEQQALALSNRQYQLQKRLPRTRELRRVVAAMNQLTGKIRELFDEQTETAENLRRKVYQDDLTGLGNRRYFEAQLNAQLETRHATAKGVLLLIQLPGLQELNLQQGYQAGDSLLAEAAAIFRSEAGGRDNSVLGRLAGGDFALFLANSDDDAARAMAGDILAKLGLRLLEKNLVTESDYGFIGGVSFDQQTSLEELLSQADNALRQARAAGAGAAVIINAQSSETLNRTEWLKVLEQALDQRAVALYTQPVVSFHDFAEVVHQEVLARIILGSRVLPAGRFVPLAEDLGRIAQLDRLIIETVAEHATEHGPTTRLAINLSPLSLRVEAFNSWLLNRLRELAGLKQAFNFEFAEAAIPPHLELISEFTRRVQEMNHRVGIDHFGRGLIHFGYLKSLQPDYVKLDRVFSSNLQRSDSDAAFFLSSLCNAAHSLDIRVMIEGIERQEQLEGLQGISLDAVQGYFIQEPEPLVVREL